MGVDMVPVFVSPSVRGTVSYTAPPRKRQIGEKRVGREVAHLE